MPRKIPYSIANYEEIVTGGYHFVDKTRFIRDLEQYKIPVFLRPRRFGKSLWCSILECYYDVNRAHRFEELHSDRQQPQRVADLNRGLAIGPQVASSARDHHALHRNPRSDEL